jgi:hypothetical protein
LNHSLLFDQKISFVTILNLQIFQVSIAKEKRGSPGGSGLAKPRPLTPVAEISGL